MKKICMITTTSLTMKSFVVETAKYLYNTCGYDITLICDTDDAFAKSLPDYLHYIPVPMSRGVNLSGFFSIGHLQRIFKKEKFDMVQYSTPNASFYASIAAKRERIPVRLYCQWGIRYVGLNGLSRIIFKNLEKAVCKNSTHIRSASNLNMHFAIGEGLYSDDKALVIGNGGTIGVDMTSYDVKQKESWRSVIREQYLIKNDDVVFGFAGRVSIDKGSCELLRAFRRISEKTSNVKLMLIGDNECTSGDLKDLIEWAKTSNSVIMTGKIANEDMKKYYSALDVMVHPTYREGFGMVIQEAGAMAVPTITTKIPGASEVMVDKESCILVEPKNEEVLFLAMKKLMTDKEAVISMGKEAYKRTAELYERKIMLDFQAQDYKSILE